MDPEIVIAQTTSDNEEQAKTVARGAVESKLAAGVHIDAPEVESTTAAQGVVRRNVGTVLVPVHLSAGHRCPAGGGVDRTGRLVLRPIRVTPQVTERLGKWIHCHESDPYPWEKANTPLNSPLIFPP
ncbi:hypothetical protein ABTZ78_02450 [Streptomyces bauhiniae]|uniref:hypothetical protein n=1 Tax=Streptomyces bauhiniae TaxID=2340725 RepID=UPI00332FA61C